MTIEAEKPKRLSDDDDNKNDNLDIMKILDSQW